MRDRLLLLGYLAAVAAATLVHDPRWLGAGAIIVFASSGRRWPRLLRRTLIAVLPITLAVALGYLVLARGEFSAAMPVLLRLTLRVLLLAGLAGRMLPSLSLQRALGFVPALRFVLVLATSQVLLFRRFLADFGLALTARSVRRPGAALSLRHGAAGAAWVLRRAEHDAAAMAEALEARGLFLDRD